VCLDKRIKPPSVHAYHKHPKTTQKTRLQHMVSLSSSAFQKGSHFCTIPSVQQCNLLRASSTALPCFCMYM
jgi:hypothetical protein